MDKKEKKYFIHESSYADEGSEIGKGTQIWHFSHIMSGAKVGENCKIGQSVLIGNGAIVGNNVKIQNNVSVYPAVELEDYVFCGPSMVFTNVFNPRSSIVRNSDEYFRKTLVKYGASIGANATIVCGVTLGQHCFVGAGSVITKDIPDYALVYGNPAKYRGWMCKCGFKLITKDEVNYKCDECGLEYILESGLLSEK